MCCAYRRAHAVAKSAATQCFAERIACRRGLHTPHRPTELGGLHLGSIVESMRIGDITAKNDPDRRATLDKIDFTWGDDKTLINGLSLHQAQQLKGGGRSCTVTTNLHGTDQRTCGINGRQAG